MSEMIDEKIVGLKFDNAQFEAGVSETLQSLSKLKKGLELDKSASALSNFGKSFRDINSSASSVSLDPLQNSVDQLNAKFSLLGTTVRRTFENITDDIYNSAKNMMKSIAIDPIKEGFGEYETKLNSVQTILANTASKGSTLEDVNKTLDELNHYADMTIYNFTEMTRNIGTFTAAGVGLEESASAIKGIANLAAASGSSSQQASTAMYQLSQALASGTVKLMDWNSVVNAGMGGELFQNALKRTANHMIEVNAEVQDANGNMVSYAESVGLTGKKVDDLIAQYGSFRETLKDGWLTKDVLTQTLQQLAGEFGETFDRTAEEAKGTSKEVIDQMEHDFYVAHLEHEGWSEEDAEAIVSLSKTATEAATKVKTFSQLIDTTKEAVGSGWAETWQIIFGDFEEARNMWTDASNVILGVIDKISTKINDLLKGWEAKGGRDEIIRAVKNIYEYVSDVIGTVKKSFEEIIPPATAQGLFEFTKKIADFTEGFKLSADQAKLLTNIFSTLFHVLNTGISIFSSAFRIAISIADALTPLVSLVLDVANGVGSLIAKLTGAADIGSGIASITDLIVAGLGAVKDALSGFVERVEDSFIWKAIFGDVAKEEDKLTESTEKLSDSFDSTSTEGMRDEMKALRKSTDEAMDSTSTEGMRDEMKALHKATDETTKSTKLSSEAMQDLVKQVIRGDFKEGAERIQLLTDAGYDAAAVQGKVNEAYKISREQGISLDEAIRQLTGDLEQNATTQEKTAEATKVTTDEMQKLVAEIISGAWGNGEERIQKLTEAGYDAAEAQAKVNEAYQISKEKGISLDEAIKQLTGDVEKNGKAEKDSATDNNAMLEEKIALKKKEQEETKKGSKEEEKANKKSKEGYEKITNAIKEKGFRKALTDGFKNFGTALLSFDTSKVFQGFKDLGNFIVNSTPIQMALTGIKNKFQDLTGVNLDEFTSTAKRMFGEIGDLGPVKAVRTALTDLKTGFIGFIKSVKDQGLGDAIGLLTVKFKNFSGINLTGAFERIRDGFTKVKTTITDFFKTWKDKGLDDAIAGLKTHFEDFIKGVKDGIKNFKLSDIKDKFKEIFGGIADNQGIQNAISKIKSAIEKAFGAIKDTFSKLTGIDLGGIGSQISGFFDGIPEDGVAANVITSVKDALSSLSNISLGGIVEDVKTFFGSLFGDGEDAGGVTRSIQTLGDSLNTPGYENLATTSENLKTFSGALVELKTGGVSSAPDLLRRIGGEMENATASLSKAGDASGKAQIPFDGIIGAIKTLGAIGTLNRLNKFTNTIGFGIPNLLDSFAKVNKATARKETTAAILNVAIAIGILAASMAVLAHVPADKLGNVASSLLIMAGALSVFAVALGAAFAGYAKIEDAKGGYDEKGILAPLHDGFENIGAGIKKFGSAAKIIAISIALLAFVAALALMKKVIEAYSELDFTDEKIQNGLIALGLVAAGLTAAMTAMSMAASRTKAYSGLASALLAFVASLWLMAKVIKMYAEMDTETFVSGGIKVKLVMDQITKSMTKMISSFTENSSLKSMAGAAILMLAFVHALKKLVGVIAAYAKMDIGTFVSGIIKLAVVMKLFTKAMGQLTSGLQGASVKGIFEMLGMILVLRALVWSLRDISNIDFDDLLAATVSLRVLLGGLASVFKQMNSATSSTKKTGLGGMIGMVALILTLTYSLNKLSQLDTEDLATATAALYLVIGRISKLAKAANKAAQAKGALFILIGVIAALGAVLWALTTYTDAADLTTTVHSLDSLVYFLGGFMKKLGKAFGEQGMTIKQSFGAVGALAVLLGAIGGVLFLLTKFGDSDKYLAAALAISGVLQSIGLIINRLSNFKTGMKNAKAVVVELGGILLAISASLVILTQFGDGSNMISAAVAMYVTMLAVGKLINHLNGFKTGMKNAKAVALELGAILLAVSGALVILSRFGKWSTILKSAEAMFLVIIALGKLVDHLNGFKTGMKNAKAVAVELGGILLAVSVSLAILSRLGGWSKMLASGKAMALVIIALAPLIDNLKGFKTNMKDAQATAVELGAVLLAIAVSLAVLTRFGDGSSMISAALAMDIVILGVCKLSKNLVKSKSTITKALGPAIQIAIVIGAIAGSLTLLTALGDWKSMISAALAIDIVILGVVKMMNRLNESKSTIRKALAPAIQIAIVVGAIAGSLTLLTAFGDWKSMLNAAISIGLVIAAVTKLSEKLISSKQSISKALAPALQIAIIIGAIAGSLTILTRFGNANSMVAAAASISLVLVALTASFAVMSKLGPMAQVSLKQLAPILLVIAGISTIIGLIGTFAPNTEGIMQTGVGLGVALAGFAAAFAVIATFGAAGPAAIAGAGAFVAVMAILSAGLGASLAIFARFSGNFGKIGEDLSALMTGLKPFIDASGTLGEDGNKVTEGLNVIKEIGNALTSMSIAGFINGLSGKLFGSGSTSLDGIGEKLADTIESLKPFIEATEGLDFSGSVEGLKFVGKAVLTFAGSNVLLGLSTWVTNLLGVGTADFSEVGDQMTAALTSLKPFAEMASGLNYSGTDAGLAFIGKSVATFAGSQVVLGLSDWISAKLGGTTTITGAADEMTSALTSLKGFAEVASGIDYSGNDQAIKEILKTVGAFSVAEIEVAIGDWVSNALGGTTSITGAINQMNTALTSLRIFLDNASQVTDYSAAKEGFQAITLAAAEWTKDKIITSIGGWIDNALGGGGVSMDTVAQNMTDALTSLGGFLDLAASYKGKYDGATEALGVITAACTAFAGDTIITALGGWVSDKLGDGRESIAEVGGKMESALNGLAGFMTTASGYKGKFEDASSALELISKSVTAFAGDSFIAAIGNAIDTWGESTEGNLDSACTKMGTALESLGGFMDKAKGAKDAGYEDASSALDVIQKTVTAFAKDSFIAAIGNAVSNLTGSNSDISAAIGKMKDALGPLDEFMDKATEIAANNYTDPSSQLEIIEKTISAFAKDTLITALAEMTTNLTGTSGDISAAIGKMTDALGPLDEFMQKATEIAGKNYADPSDQLSIISDATAAFAKATFFTAIGEIISNKSKLDDDSLSDVGTKLSNALESLEPFMETAEGMSFTNVNESLGAIASAAETIGKASFFDALSEMFTGVSKFFTGGDDGEDAIDGFKDKLRRLGEGLAGFGEAFEGVDLDDMTKATEIAGALSDMATNIDIGGGLFSEDNLTKFGGKLVTFGTNLSTFAGSISGIETSDIDAIVESCKGIAAFGTDGTLDGFEASSFSELTKAISALQTADFAGFAGGLASMTGIDPASIGKIKDIFVELVNVSQEMASDTTLGGDATSYSKFHTLKTWLEDLNDIKIDPTKFTSITESLKELGETGVDALAEAFKDPDGKVADAISKLLNGVGEETENGESGSGAFEEAAKKSVDAFTGAIEDDTTIRTATNKWIKKALNALKDKSDQFENKAGILIKAVKKKFENDTTVKTAAGTLASHGASGVSGKASEFRKEGRVLAVQLGVGVLLGMSSLKSAVEAIVEQAKSVVDDSEWETIGGYIPAGLARGIQSGSGPAYSAVIALAQNLKTKARNVLDERSPSKEFAQIGEYVSEGLGIGITDKAREAYKSVITMAGGVISSAADALGVHSPSTVFKDYIAGNIVLGLAEGIRSYTPSALYEISSLADGLVTQYLKKSKEAWDKKSKDDTTGEKAVKYWQGILDKQKKGSNEYYAAYAALANAETEVAKKFVESLAGIYAVKQRIQQDDVLKTVDALNEKVKKSKEAIEKYKKILKDEKSTEKQKADARKAIAKEEKNIRKYEEDAAKKRQSVYKKDLKATAKYWADQLKTVKEGSAKYLAILEKVDETVNELIETGEKDWSRKSALYAVGDGDELEYWREFRRQLESEGITTGEAYQKVVDKIADLEIDYINGTAERGEKYIASRKKWHDVSLLEEYNYWLKLLATATAGTNNYKNIYEHIEEISEGLVSDVQSAKMEYAQGVIDRTKSLISSVGGLFDEFESRDIDFWRAVQAHATQGTEIYETATKKVEELSKVTPQSILNNARTRLEGLRFYQRNMAALTARMPLPVDMIKELQELGPQAADKIAAMNQMTDAELKEFVKIWQQTGKTAFGIAQSEVDPNDYIQKVVDSINGLTNTVTGLFLTFSRGGLISEEAAKKWGTTVTGYFGETIKSMPPMLQAAFATTNDSFDTYIANAQKDGKKKITDTFRIIFRAGKASIGDILKNSGVDKATRSGINVALQSAYDAAKNQTGTIVEKVQYMQDVFSENLKTQGIELDEQTRASFAVIFTKLLQYADTGIQNVTEGLPERASRLISQFNTVATGVFTQVNAGISKYFKDDKNGVGQQFMTYFAQQMYKIRDAGGTDVVSNLEKLKEIALAKLAELGDSVPAGFREFVEQVFDTQIGAAKVEEAKTNFKKFYEEVKDDITKQIDKFVSDKTIDKKTGETLKDKIKGIYKNVFSSGKDFDTMASEFKKQVTEALTAAGITITPEIQKAIEKYVEEAKASATKAASEASAESGAAEGSKKGASTSAQSAADGVTKEIQDAVTPIFNTTKETVAGLDWEGIGKNINGGIKKGIDATAQEPVNALSAVASALVEEFKKKLDMHSPSRVFAGFGRYTVEGYYQGVIGSSNLATSGIDSLASSIVTEFNRHVNYDAGKDAGSSYASGVSDGFRSYSGSSSSSESKIPIVPNGYHLIEQSKWLGSELVRSIVSGIDSEKLSAINSMKDFADTLVDNFMKAEKKAFEDANEDNNNLPIFQTIANELNFWTSQMKSFTKDSDKYLVANAKVMSLEAKQVENEIKVLDGLMNSKAALYHWSYEDMIGFWRDQLKETDIASNRYKQILLTIDGYQKTIVEKAEKNWTAITKRYTMSKEEELNYWVDVASELTPATEQYKTALQKIDDIRDDIYNSTVENAEKELTEKKKLHTVGYEEERAYWQKLLLKLDEGTTEYNDALSKIEDLDIEYKNNLQERSESELQARKDYYNVSLDEEKTFWEQRLTYAEEGTTEYEDIQKKISEVERDRYNNQIEELETQITKEKKLRDVSLQEELDRFKALKDTLTLGTKEYDDALDKIYDIEKEINDKRLEDMQTQVDEAEKALQKRKDYYTVSSDEELEYWKKLLPELDSESDAYKNVLDKIYDIEKEKYNNIVEKAEESLNKLKKTHDYSSLDEAGYWREIVGTLKEGTAEYEEAIDKISEITDSLVTSTKDALKTYEDNIKSRADSVSSAVGGLFDKFKMGSKHSEKSMVSALQSQIDGLTKYNDNMQKLIRRGAPEELLKQLRDLGPSATKDLMVLNEMSDEQWNEYISLYKEKADLAQQIAVNEVKPTELTDVISNALKSGLNDGTKLGSEEYANAANSLISGIVSAIENSDMRDKLNEIGYFASQGFINGTNEESPFVQQAFSALGQLAVSSTAEALDSHSPSQKFIELGENAGLGFILGLQMMLTGSSSVSEEMGMQAILSMQQAIAMAADILNSDPNAQPVITPVLDLSNIESGVGNLSGMLNVGTDVRLSRAANPDNFKNLSGKNAGDGSKNYTFVQNNYSPKALSRLELYRQTKNQFAMVKGAL